MPSSVTASLSTSIPTRYCACLPEIVGILMLRKCCACSIFCYLRCRQEWRHFAADLANAERAAGAAKGGFAFAFVEGKLVQALRNGW